MLERIHDEFMEKRRTDPYVAFCFSFGNNLRSYCYSEKTEKLKKALDYAISFSDFKLLENLGVNIDHNLAGRLKITSAIKLNNLQIQHLERLERLESLQHLQHLQHLDLTNKDYADVQIKENSVIYCDPPYSCSESYLRTIKFDYEAFYSWCRKQKELVIISEYNMPDDFICVAEKEKISLMRSSNRTTKIEKLFVPKHQYQMYLGE